jgi:hypothetical protein
MANEATKFWYRLPFRIALFVVTLIWLGQVLYAGRLLLTDGPRGVLSWLYHIARPMTDEGQLIVPTPWDVIIREGCLLVLTIVLWFASGLHVLPRRKDTALIRYR